MEPVADSELFPNGCPGRLRKLLATIHDEGEQLLSAHGLFDLSSYGWLDQDTPNPEYVGHATWQISPPFEHDWETLLNGGMVSYTPTKSDEILLCAGENFVGTMRFARRSLGTALCYAALASSESLFFDTQEFWHDYTTTLPGCRTLRF
jgi:hypothetical protein